MHRIVIVAIDGPAGAGKSTTARRVATALGFLYLDTGAMYRAVALSFLRSGTPFDDAGAAPVLSSLRLSVRTADDGQHVFLGEEDVTGSLRSPEVSEAASRVSALASVRAFLVEEQRRIAAAQTMRGSGVVMEGRDIGTVVFPGAELKIFLTADPSERARRRAAEYAERGESSDTDAIASEMRERDRRDSDRAVAPLRPADDAVLLDTTSLSFEEQVEHIVDLARRRAS